MMWRLVEEHQIKVNQFTIPRLGNRTESVKNILHEIMKAFSTHHHLGCVVIGSYSTMDLILQQVLVNNYK